MADKIYDVIIVGGSYAGLSAAMALGRALRNILVIDSGKPCNRQTPHSHNFITHDGQTPAQISKTAKEQVLQYTTVSFYNGLAVSGVKTNSGFQIITEAGETFSARRLLFASGLKDIMPDIKGFAECWGISVLHCPYCHGYEVRSEKTGIISNGADAFHFVQLIFNWTKELTLFTNGKSTLTQEQKEKIKKNKIKIIETEIDNLDHDRGKIQHVILKDQTKIALKAIYARPQFVQNSAIPESLGCELTEQGVIKVDGFQKTNIQGVYACGDSSAMRAVAVAVSSGMTAGAVINNDLASEEF